jgi:hypothetical protein
MLRTKNKRLLGALPPPFFQILYPLMQESSTLTLFLHQANSLTNNNVNGNAPIISGMVKKTMDLFRACPSIHDQDEAVQFIVEHKQLFSLIVTRPGMLRDAPSKKRLTASRSLPGIGPRHQCRFGRILTRGAHGPQIVHTAPYVVSDGELKHVSSMYIGVALLCAW